MFDHTRIKEAFSKLAGLRQNDNPSFDQIASSLTYDGNNVLIQHPLINIENLDMCARNYGKYIFAPYAAGNYLKGARVTNGGLIYEALQNTAEAPPHADWQQVNLLSLYLQDVFENAAEDTVTEVLNITRTNQMVKTIISSVKMFSGAGNMNDKIVNEGHLVGVAIRMNRPGNVLAIIEQIGLQLTVPQTLTLRLYHSSQAEAIASVNVIHTKTLSFQWHDVKWKLNYMNADHDAGGVFFLVYDQADLVGQAIKKRHNFHLAPCGSCSPVDTQNFYTYSRYVTVNSIRIRHRNTDDPLLLWDIERVEYTPDNNWGLNFQLTVRCDITDVLLQQRDVFQYAVRDMITKKLLEAMAASTRQNATQEKVAVMARNELMAQYAGGMGFMKQLMDQLKAVNFELSGLDETCLPCQKKGTIGVGSYGLSRGR